MRCRSSWRIIAACSSALSNCTKDARSERNEEKSKRDSDSETLSCTVQHDRYVAWSHDVQCYTKTQISIYQHMEIKSMTAQEQARNSRLTCELASG